MGLQNYWFKMIDGDVFVRLHYEDAKRFYEDNEERIDDTNFEYMSEE